MRRKALPPELEAALRQRPPGDRRDAAHLWHLMADADVLPQHVPSTEAAWDDLARRLDGAPALPKRPGHAPDRTPRRAFRRHPVGWTAGILTTVLLLAGLGMWRQPVTVEVPPGGRQTVVLPDGSAVELNSGSRLAYRRGFALWPFTPPPARRVRLRGEAFFDVTHDGRPFVVETFNARIDVLGTRFNVRAWPVPSAGATQVTLAEGRVRAGMLEATLPGVVLSEPGQTARIPAGRAAPTPAVDVVDLHRALAWRQGGFAMVDQPVSAILEEVQRVFAVSVKGAGGLVVSDSMTVIYQQKATAETVIHDICLAQGWHYRRTGQGFVLSKDTPRP